jgi:hypothetical protein
VRLAGSVNLLSLDIQDASQVLVSGNGGYVLHVGDLTMSQQAQLNLNDNALVIKSEESRIQTLMDWAAGALSRSYGSDGRWNGQSGITSNAAERDVSGFTTLMVVRNRDLDGRALTGFGAFQTSDLIIRYTWIGDADLSGHVDADDLLIFDYQDRHSGALPFARSDFNLNGEMDIDDRILLDRVFVRQNGTPWGKLTN